jgi:hypothetical protein
MTNHHSGPSAADAFVGLATDEVTLLRRLEKWGGAELRDFRRGASCMIRPPSAITEKFGFASGRIWRCETNFWEKSEIPFLWSRWRLDLGPVHK